MKTFAGRAAVITGAGSGFGLELARLAATRGMPLVLLDVQADALERAASELRGAGADVMAERVDVSNAAAMERLAAAVHARFGAPGLVFNNAGIGAGGLVWENTLKDWEWVLGVNLMGVIHGVRLFVPMMLEAEQRDRSYEGHVVNTASMAGLVNMPNMGVYNVSKHAVVSLTETLYQDLKLVSDRIGASVLCPFFVPTGITASERNRPPALKDDRPLTKSQLIGKAMSEKAVSSGKVTAAHVAQFVMDAVAEDRFYVYSHPHALNGVQSRLTDIANHRNPSDPFAARPEIGAQLRAQLRAAG
jgi:NAD(P)-dependent dehydrogenase (short-subunit alcohol dehydrogenase family)